MTGFEPEPLSFQVERTTQWTTRATHTELASFRNTFIFCNVLNMASSDSQIDQIQRGRLKQGPVL